LNPTHLPFIGDKHYSTIAIILNNAISKYIVADNSKFDSYSFYSFYRLDNLSAVVTDDNIATKVKEKYSTYVEIL